MSVTDAGCSEPVAGTAPVADATTADAVDVREMVVEMVDVLAMT